MARESARKTEIQSCNKPLWMKSQDIHPFSEWNSASQCVFWTEIKKLLASGANTADHTKLTTGVCQTNFLREERILVEVEGRWGPDEEEEEEEA